MSKILTYKQIPKLLNCSVEIINIDYEGGRRSNLNFLSCGTLLAGGHGLYSVNVEILTFK